MDKRLVMAHDVKGFAFLVELRVQGERIMVRSERQGGQPWYLSVDDATELRSALNELSAVIDPIQAQSFPVEPWCG